METTHATNAPSVEPVYGDFGTPALGTLPPELLLLAALTEHQGVQLNCTRQEIADAYERLEQLRAKIAEAMERAREAQDKAGFWGDVSNVFGGDIATIAGVVASAAAVAASGGTASVVILAAVAAGFTAGGEVAEELGADPKLVMGLKLAGAAVGLLCGNTAGTSQLWSTVETGARVAEGGAIAAGGAAHIVEGQYKGDVAEARGEATYFRRAEQLESDLTDEHIEKIEELVTQLRFVTQAATSINENRHAVEQSVIQRIGG